MEFAKVDPPPSDPLEPVFFMLGCLAAPNLFMLGMLFAWKFRGKPLILKET